MGNVVYVYIYMCWLRTQIDIDHSSRHCDGHDGHAHKKEEYEARKAMQHSPGSVLTLIVLSCSMF